LRGDVNVSAVLLGIEGEVFGVKSHARIIQKEKAAGWPPFVQDGAD
jgi:hypothetical protein